MSDFPKPILDYWHKSFRGTAIGATGDFTLSIVSSLDRKRPVMLLERQDDRTQAAVTPELADFLGNGAHLAGAVGLREGVVRAGVNFYDPDFLFYYPADAMPDVSHKRSARQLTEADHIAFCAFHSSASQEDREDAFVELDHWAVFGCFDGDRLVSAASAILWKDSPLADLGVLTLPDARGRGYARAAVLAISAYARQQGYKPQYRCQLDNQASIALAKACGFALFGRWTVGTGWPE
ncbi:RimJ/RimL family protein N-acetyltransferase [Sphingomonas sp. SORGH_AS870]|uniref:GNAT family N-acetyltransferase n=1 Tax=Sphingomonas sp. SORGH_AS_0870 TaxID=3041801 RepID=UPI00285C765C|nr:GNAT family N-acetyltransferase [Sphingomonas sp. SORGH_AS_0870]MDR6146549.1 RimJ/RimL family protein N-acetyltransferase [Sphingomonas sp. SORGH_AS_0870]